MIQAAHRNGKPRVVVDDDQSARMIVRVERGDPLDSDEMRRLDEFWSEAALVARRPEDFDALVARLRRDDPSRAESVDRALARARLDPESAACPAKVDFGIIDSRAFSAAEYRLEFLVKNLLVRGQPCVVGGPRKALKTSVMVELAVALAGAVPFLGEERFSVGRSHRTLFLSGESGAATLQETARRICEARGVDLDHLGKQLLWGFTLPKLGDPRHVEALAEFIEANGIEAVIIDPLYLCLLSGGDGAKRIDPANLFDVGPLLASITEAILAAGATPILVHHLRKNRDNPEAPPELEDLAYAGVQEFARQWIMLSRRSAYEPGTGEHKLWLNVGGSAGHSGAWALDVSEGVVDEDFRGRRWETRLISASEARVEARQQAEASKAEKLSERERSRADEKSKRLADDCEAALTALRGMADAEGRAGFATKNAWKNRLVTWDHKRFSPVVERLVDTGRVVISEVSIKAGKGARTADGFRIAPPCDGPDHAPSGPNPDEPGSNPDEPGNPGSIVLGDRTRMTRDSLPPLKGGESPNPGSVRGGSGGNPDDRTRMRSENPGSAGEDRR